MHVRRLARVKVLLLLAACSSGTDVLDASVTDGGRGDATPR